MHKSPALPQAQDPVAQLEPNAVPVSLQQQSNQYAESVRITPERLWNTVLKAHSEGQGGPEGVQDE